MCDSAGQTCCVQQCLITFDQHVCSVSFEETQRSFGSSANIVYDYVPVPSHYFLKNIKLVRENYQENAKQ
mgnify:CR=1 FL=1